VAGAVVGTIIVFLGMSLIVAGADYPQSTTTRIDPNSAVQFNQPVRGRDNWIEIGVGLPLLIAGTPTMVTQLSRAIDANQQVGRYSPP
jgi:hypothetical protein